MQRPTEPAQDFVPFATAAIDFHQALNLPASPLVASRSELDSLHAHLTSLLALLDAHAQRAGKLLPTLARPLAAARLRAWQVTDLLHTAFHAAPHDGGEPDPPSDLRSGLPEGAPELTICHRHQRASRLLRRRATPTDLRHDRP
ncbi:DUF6238 family protein [Streptomyces sp. NPDC002896]|uniref:DUF6238 family protein n=1 Tax=Streptomyces sp. NPDC002896 TaxID=3154438 RepID=UPI003328ADB6